MTSFFFCGQGMMKKILVGFFICFFAMNSFAEVTVYQALRILRAGSQEGVVGLLLSEDMSNPKRPDAWEAEAVDEVVAELPADYLKPLLLSKQFESWPAARKKVVISGLLRPSTNVLKRIRSGSPQGDFFLFVKEDYRQRLELMREYAGKNNQWQVWGSEFLIVASNFTNADGVLFLLNQGVKPKGNVVSAALEARSMQKAGYLTALATVDDQFGVVMQLIDAGGDVNALKSGVPPLFFALNHVYIADGCEADTSKPLGLGTLQGLGGTPRLVKEKCGVGQYFGSQDVALKLVETLLAHGAKIPKELPDGVGSPKDWVRVSGLPGAESLLKKHNLYF